LRSTQILSAVYLSLPVFAWLLSRGPGRRGVSMHANTC
jgi:hypothetical protein